MGQVTVMTGPERRRRWSDSEKLAILAEAFSPESCVADVARRHDLSTGLIYTWRSKLRRLPGPSFVEAVVADDARPISMAHCAAIVIELPGGSRVNIAASAPAALVMASLKALR